MIDILSLNAEDRKRLDSYALRCFSDWQDRILSRAPALRQLNTEQTRALLRTYLRDNELAEFSKYLADVEGWLSACMDTGDRYCPDAYATWIIQPMSTIESLLVKACERAEAERRRKEYEDRWCAAHVSMDPPVDEAKKYLNDEEQKEFLLVMGRAIDAYLQEGEACVADVRTVEYGWWLKKIQECKNKEERRLQAIESAIEYNHRVNREIVSLASKLGHKRKHLANYFRAEIKEKRYTNHNFDYVLSREDEMNLDRVLVSMVSRQVEGLCSEELRQFVMLPPKCFRRYYPLPSADYSCEEGPSLEFRFDVFVTAYAEVWLRPRKKSFHEYEFHLPWSEERNDLVPLEKPKLLGYHHLILRPEDLNGYVFWQRIPLVLLKGLLRGQATPEGCTITAASTSVTTYRVKGFKKEVALPDRFIDYLVGVGSIDSLLAMGVMTDKVCNIINAALGESEAKHRTPTAGEKPGRRHTMKKRAFELFDNGKRPSDPEVEALGLRRNSAYRYYQAWKKACNHTSS